MILDQFIVNSCCVHFLRAGRSRRGAKRHGPPASHTAAGGLTLSGAHRISAVLVTQKSAPGLTKVWLSPNRIEGKRLSCPCKMRSGKDLLWPAVPNHTTPPQETKPQEALHKTRNITSIINLCYTDFAVLSNPLITI
jgi:hypothetical protein